MQTTDKSNVVSIFANKNSLKEDEENIQDDDLSFEDVMTRNKRNADRLKKERGQANKSVLRSYRIKH